MKTIQRCVLASILSLAACTPEIVYKEVPVTRIVIQKTDAPPERRLPELSVNLITKDTTDSSAVNMYRLQVDTLMTEIIWYRSVLDGYREKAKSDAATSLPVVKDN